MKRGRISSTSRQPRGAPDVNYITGLQTVHRIISDGALYHAIEQPEWFKVTSRVIHSCRGTRSLQLPTFLHHFLVFICHDRVKVLQGSISIWVVAMAASDAVAVDEFEYVYIYGGRRFR